MKSKLPPAALAAALLFTLSACEKTKLPDTAEAQAAQGFIHIQAERQ